MDMVLSEDEVKEDISKEDALLRQMLDLYNEYYHLSNPAVRFLPGGSDTTGDLDQTDK